MRNAEIEYNKLKLKLTVFHSHTIRRRRREDFPEKLFRHQGCLSCGQKIFQVGEKSNTTTRYRQQIILYIAHIRIKLKVLLEKSPDEQNSIRWWSSSSIIRLQLCFILFTRVGNSSYCSTIGTLSQTETMFGLLFSSVSACIIISSIISTSLMRVNNDRISEIKI